MQRTTTVRNQISPLLERLIVQLDAEGSATQRAHFARIHRRLAQARDEVEIATPILELSTSTVVGFRFSRDADALICRILEKSEHVFRDLEVKEGIRH